MKGLIETNIKKLHKVANPIVFGEGHEEEIQKVTDALFNAYNELDGKLQGLSAVQVGYNVSCILLQYDKTKKKPPIVVYNPFVLQKYGVVQSNEGCLSEGVNKRWIVYRPALCKVRYCDITGKPHYKWLTYKKARVFCHEWDHTRGILLQDKGVLVHA